MLDVGCGAGTDLVRFARGGAIVTGVDISSSAIELARQNFAQQGLAADLREADGEQLPFEADTFDLVFAHGVVQYTPDTQKIVDECRRVLKPGGQAVFQVYNRISWLNALSKLMKVPLEHEDAPVLKKFSAGEFRALLRGFSDVRIVEERFPVKSRLHGGWKGTLFNTFFVGTFNALPRGLVRRVRLAPARLLQQVMPITLVKAHAFGNDFLLLEEADAPVRHRSGRVRAGVCERHRGIGADGLIVYRGQPQAACRMPLLNADGSYSEVSGNGVRCLAAWIAARHAA